ncbi:hypothetical protein QFZ37_000924 [Chryseobacterium ginsenosidimutans]|nr:hypothetical protein [Chryseobacterium ginsenosidimutans]
MKKSNENFDEETERLFKEIEQSQKELNNILDDCDKNNFT